MNFDIKDVKSWANRHEVKVGDEGYFFDAIRDLKEDCYPKHKGKIIQISDDCGFPFLKGNSQYCFFLPLDAVKEDKPKEKKYRPIKNMRELTEVMRGKDWEHGISTDSEIIVRRKDKVEHRIKMLITEIDFKVDRSSGEEILGCLNYNPMPYWFELYELMNNKGEWIPFGVEVKDEY